MDALLGFLRDVSEPFLRIFRRLIPSMGAIDLSPMLAILVLIVVRAILVNAIGGMTRPGVARRCGPRSWSWSWSRSTS